jgi:hypothetical protein
VLTFNVIAKDCISMMGNEQECIYCGEPKRSSDEHVFPAGLGGDDSRYILKEGVCADCNNGFSGIEATFMRRSVVALARSIHQVRNRDGRAPTFDPVESHITDEQGVAFQAGYVNGFNLEVFPQIIIVGEEITTSGPSKEKLISFLEKARTVLNRPELQLVEKNRSNTRNKFSISRFQYQGGTFHFHVKEGADKAPGNGIWVDQTSNAKVDNDCCLYRRSGSQLVIKAGPDVPIGKLLASIRHSLPLILAQAEHVESQSITHPLVTTSSLGWSGDCDRVVAKIGINFLAKQFGLDAARHPDLLSVKAFIAGRSDSFRTSFLEVDTKLDVFGNVPEGHHCVLLWHEASSGRSRPMICMQLFGGIGLSMMLADDLPEKTASSLTYYLIDYTSNAITKYDFLDYQRQFNLGFARRHAEQWGIPSDRLGFFSSGSANAPTL